MSAESALYVGLIADAIGYILTNWRRLLRECLMLQDVRACWVPARGRRYQAELTK